MCGRSGEWKSVCEAVHSLLSALMLIRSRLEQVCRHVKRSTHIRWEGAVHYPSTMASKCIGLDGCSCLPGDLSGATIVSSSLCISAMPPHMKTIRPGPQGSRLHWLRGSLPHRQEAVCLDMQGLLNCCSGFSCEQNGIEADKAGHTRWIFSEEQLNLLIKSYALSLISLIINLLIVSWTPATA